MAKYLLAFALVALVSGAIANEIRKLNDDNSGEVTRTGLPNLSEFEVVTITDKEQFEAIHPGTFVEQLRQSAAVRGVISYSLGARTVRKYQSREDWTSLSSHSIWPQRQVIESHEWFFTELVCDF